jgi:hypothetical protein
MAYRATGAVVSPVGLQASGAYQVAVARYNLAVAARQATIDTIAREASVYNAQMAAYDAAVAQIKARDKQNMAGFSQAYSAWQQRKNAYDAAVANRTQILNAQKQQSDAALAHVTPPAGYSGCLTQADHDAYVRRCSQSANVTVKGVGRALGEALFGLSGGDSAECLWSNLPVCVALPALPPEPGYPPVAPGNTQLPPPPKKPPVRKVPPMPVKPVPPPLTITPSTPPMMASKPEPQPKSFAVAGLLAAVIVAGGGVAYFHFKKKKKAAA